MDHSVTFIADHVMILFFFFFREALRSGTTLSPLSWLDVGRSLLFRRVIRTWSVRRLPVLTF